MSGQMSLADAGWWPVQEVGEDSSDQDFVVGQLPLVGYCRGTWREPLRRPLGMLYARTNEVSAHDLWELVSEGGHRDPYRRVAKTHGGAVYMLDFLNGMDRHVADFRGRLKAGLKATGVALGAERRILLPALAPLVIAMCWDDSVRAGCFLATAAAPLGYDWHASVDLALCQGLPWAERLAVLARKHEPLVRAWHWLHEQGHPHPLRPRPSP